MVSQSSELSISKHLQKWACNWSVWVHRVSMGSGGGEDTKGHRNRLFSRPVSHGNLWFPGSGMVPGNLGTCRCFIRSKVSAAENQQISKTRVFLLSSFMEDADFIFFQHISVCLSGHFSVQKYWMLLFTVIIIFYQSVCVKNKNDGLQFWLELVKQTNFLMTF